MSRLQLGLGMAPVLQSACAMKRCCWLARQACPPQLLHLALLPAMASCRLPSRSICSALPSICALLCRMACPPVLPLLLHMLSCLTLACAAARHVPCALPGIACTLPCACPACHGSEAGTAPGVGSPAACCTSHRRVWLPSARIPPPSEARAVPGPGQRQYPARDRWGIRCCPAAVARTPAPSAALTGGRRCRRSPCAAPVCRRSGRRRPGLERSRCWTACGPPLMRPSHSRSVTCTGGGPAGMGQVDRPGRMLDGCSAGGGWYGAGEQAAGRMDAVPQLPRAPPELCVQQQRAEQPAGRSCAAATRATWRATRSARRAACGASTTSSTTRSSRWAGLLKHVPLGANAVEVQRPGCNSSWRMRLHSWRPCLRLMLPAPLGQWRCCHRSLLRSSILHSVVYSSRIFVPFAPQRILYLSCRGLSKTAVELSVTTDYKYNTGSLPQLRGCAICCGLRWLVLGGRGQSWRQSPSARATQGGPWCGCPSSHIRQPASLRLAAADVVAAAQPSGPPVTCPACCPADDEGEEVDAATSMANEMDL